MGHPGRGRQVPGGEDVKALGASGGNDLLLRIVLEEKLEGNWERILDAI